MRLKCYMCGRPVSTDIPNSTVMLGFIQCGFCIQAELNWKVVQIERHKGMQKVSLGNFDDIGIGTGANEDHRKRIKALEEKIDNIIPDEDLALPIIDIGANCGHFLRKLWLRGARNLTGVEPRKEHLEIARQWCEYEGAEVTWIEDVCESVTPELLQDKILLVLGLVYHLPDPSVLYKVIKESSFKYGIMESQLWPGDGQRKEDVNNAQHTFVAGQVWSPCPESIEAKFREYGLQYERIDYEPRAGGKRGLWKFWK